MAGLILLAVMLWGIGGPPALARADMPGLSSPSSLPDETGPAVLRLAIGEWAPYTGSDLPHYGCDARVVSEAFAAEGVRVVYDFFPWARAFANSTGAKWDGTLDWADTPTHRESHLISTKPLSRQAWVFFHHRDYAFDWTVLDDLAGCTVGVTGGYVYSDLFNDLKAAGRATFDVAPSDRLNFRKLLNRRIDIFPMERRVGLALMARIFSRAEQDQIVIHPKPIDEFRAYLLLSREKPGNAWRMTQFNRSFRRLEESGRYEQIMQQCEP